MKDTRHLLRVADSCSINFPEVDFNAESRARFRVVPRLAPDIDLAGIIDGVIPRRATETGPSLGEYFLYCVWNRIIDAVSKRQLADWYAKTAVQQIRPVDVAQLSSERYWQKWDRVGRASRGGAWRRHRRPRVKS